MKHTYVSPFKSTFSFGNKGPCGPSNAVVEIEFSGNINQTKTADIQDVRFLRWSNSQQEWVKSETTRSILEDFADFMGGMDVLYDAAKEMHCPQAARQMEADGLKLCDITPSQFEA